MPSLASLIEDLFDHPPGSAGSVLANSALRETYSEEDRRIFQKFKDALNAGEVRAAEPHVSSPSGWRVNAWVKKGILLGFRMGSIVEMGPYPTAQPFLDKSTYPVKTLHLSDGVRLVPGGSSIRDGDRKSVV